MRAKKILFVSKSRQAASTRYRAVLFFPYLQQQGWEVEHFDDPRGLINRAKLLKAVRSADIVIVLRRSFTALFLYMIRQGAQKLVFDFDDAIYCRNNGSYSRTRSKRVSRAIRLADQVWAGNRYLADYALQHNNNVHIVPTSINSERYSVNGLSMEENALRLIWIGSRSKSIYLHLFISLLENMCEEVANVVLVNVSDVRFESGILPVENVQWSPQAEIDELSKAHAGIAPMSDDEWSRGKCGFKVLQYMAAGLPVISSPVGVNAELVDHGENGFLADSEAEWRKYINCLSGDAGLRKSMGDNARKKVEACFSTRIVANQVIAKIHELL